MRWMSLVFAVKLLAVLGAHPIRAWPLQCMVATMPELGPIANTIATLVTRIPMAVLFWIVVEKPSLGFRHVVMGWLDDQMDRGVVVHQLKPRDPRAVTVAGRARRIGRQRRYRR